MPNTKKPLVLVVDDNPLNRELAKALLDCLGFRSVEAVDGFDALKKYQACEPVAVLMDFTMPNLGGLEALKQLRELELHLGRKRVPVVILTASEASRQPNDWRLAGGDGALSKPLRYEHLCNVLMPLIASQHSHESRHHEKLAYKG
jgi:CheY-like chemotaxis protein